MELIELVEIGAIAAIINGMIIQPLWLVLWLQSLEKEETKALKDKWW